jgi:hypothetical protein
MHVCAALRSAVTRLREKIQKKISKEKGGAEIASTGNRNYGNGKYKSAHSEMMENAGTENRSIIRYGGKRKYGNGKY